VKALIDTESDRILGFIMFGASAGEIASEEVASIQKRQRKLVFRPKTKRLEASGTTRVDFFMCGIGRDARDFLHKEGC
jgi:hypothetical protein